MAISDLEGHVGLTQSQHVAMVQSVFSFPYKIALLAGMECVEEFRTMKSCSNTDSLMSFAKIYIYLLYLSIYRLID